MIDIIKDTALIGTDRKTIKLISLPNDIMQCIDEQDSAEQQLLDAMTYLHFYDAHGKNPFLTVENIESAIDEIQEDTPEAINEVLKEISMSDEILIFDWLTEWIDFVHTTNYKMQNWYILDVLELASKLSKTTRKKLYDIIGNRARYMLKMFPKKEFLFHEEKEIWSLGNTQERIDYFKTLRINDHVASITLIKHDWSQLNINEKKSILVSISETLKYDDLDFISSLYTSEFEFKMINKPGVRFLKKLTISMLLRLKYIPLYNQLKPQLQRYITAVNKGIISTLIGNKSKSISLPQKSDDFWNGSLLNLQFGIDETNQNPALFDYDPQFWMSELIEICPLSLWEEVLDRNTDGIISYFLNDSTFKTKIKGGETSIYRNALVQNVLLTRDSALTDVLSKYIDGYDMEQCVPNMSQSGFESYVLRNKLFLNLQILDMRSNAPDNQWTLTFTKNCISELLKYGKGGNFNPNAKFGWVMGKYFHPEAFEYLTSFSLNFYTEHWFQRWNENIVQVVQKTLKIRSNLNKLKSAK